MHLDPVYEKSGVYFCDVDWLHVSFMLDSFHQFRKALPVLACIPLAIAHSHSCLNIHASHIANVCLLSICVNAVLSVFHDLFTHLSPLRTSIFNRGGSHVFPWLQNGYGVQAQHAQCGRIFQCVICSRSCTWRSAGVKLGVLRRDKHVQCVFLKKTAICMFCQSKSESELLKVWS